ESELERAKENLKGRMMLAMESTSNRMSRLGRSLIADTELLSLDRLMAEVDAVEPAALSELASALPAPERPSAAGIRPDEDRFALGAVLMMRFAEEAARHLPAAEIVELHHETKVDAPSGTAKATRERLGGDVPIHSVRLPGIVAHQEVLLGGQGQLLTIRHDAYSREAYLAGVLLVLEKLPALPPGLTTGLESILELG